ncbi:MAG: hypothetical protein II293_01895 [Bacteroidaceae bacterium]|nr:hypothetical protein [Bacteroidaceae bacterium]
MKKIFATLAIVVATMGLTGCGTAFTASNNLTQTQVVLSEKNFKVIGQAYGESTATYICGIGGLSQKALRNNAIDVMSRNANLKGAQTLTNITTHTSVKMITPLYVKVTCSATANIVEFK